MRRDDDAGPECEGPAWDAGADLFRDWSSSSLRDDYSESFGSAFREVPAQKAPPRKKSRRWSKGLRHLGFIHRRRASGRKRQRGRQIASFRDLAGAAGKRVPRKREVCEEQQQRELEGFGPLRQCSWAWGHEEEWSGDQWDREEEG
ncbi:uncharacterized protein A4U43_C07F390 [Asparagus officinalis]|uniref:Uncharacterized protein n=1 Tax=Asparagus officinalis TaxID=4686 RepID=A0A5P1E8P2_ASPOF|nr:uncharacterized protein A4U43_C07F390 [Asparagus officinalis]